MLNTILNRQDSIFSKDLKAREKKISNLINKSSFLILGGAGSIGQSVVKLILKYKPKRLHVVDISENNLVELVRDVRSQNFKIIEEFRTFPIDIGSKIYDSFFNHDGNYDYIINLSALKHVRSEKNYYSMSSLNISNASSISLLFLIGDETSKSNM
jgi:FlaA1/EpsC-like NDP-sugar epimerase